MRSKAGLGRRCRARAGSSPAGHTGGSDKTGVARTSLHTLEATGDIRKVALWLGHASLQSTALYLRVDPVDKLDTLATRQPPNLRKGSFDGVRDELLALLGGFAAH